MPEIKSMFDKIVKRYDFLNRLLSFWQDILWRKKMASLATAHQLQATNYLILDLATGTGDSAEALIKKGAKVIGADISFEMIRIAKTKIKDSFVPVCASGYQLSFKDNIFDAVTCAFGIRNMHETELALREIYRVLKKNGKIVILEFSLPEGFFRKPYLFYLKKIIPFVASLFSVRSAYEYLGSSIDGFYKPKEFLDLLESCGFRNATSISLSFGCVHLYVAEKV